METIPDRSRFTRSATGPHLGLLADDVTGACDAGVQFSERGISSLLLFDEQPLGSGEPDLLIRTSDSRNDSPSTAHEKVARLSQWFHNANRALIFKKIDSTLHGNLASEIYAAMEPWGMKLAVVAPGFPAMERTLVDGWLRGPQSALVPCVHLPTLLSGQGASKVVHVPAAVLRAGAENLVTLLGEMASSELQVAVVDSVTQEDLAIIARAALALEPPALVVGSAGLAAEVATGFAGQFGRTPQRPARELRPSLQPQPVVLFIGSRNPRTVAQVDYLLSTGTASRLALRDFSEDLLQRASEKGTHLIVTIDGEEEESRIRDFVSCVFQLAYRRLVVSGGDTAHLICKALRARGIKLESEISCGLPWGRILGGAADGLPIATKAGGFGPVEALAKATTYLAACGETKE